MDMSFVEAAAGLCAVLTELRVKNVLASFMFGFSYARLLFWPQTRR
jgi:hypothetical protein